MQKYFKIGEISKLYNIGVDSIRYYEKVGIIKPKRAESGYRLYSINDIWRLNVIRELIGIGFGTDEIKKYLNSHSLKSTLELLRHEEKTIDEKIAELKKLKANVKMRMKTLSEAENLELDIIKEEEIKERRYFNISKSYSDEYEMDVLINRLVNIDRENFYIIGNNQIGTFIPLNEETMKYKSVFIIDEKGDKKLRSGRYLTVSYKGQYEKSNEWIEKMRNYARENKLKLGSEAMELLWVDVHSSSNVGEHITQLQIYIEE